jgi:hypothetical protein
MQPLEALPEHPTRAGDLEGHFSPRVNESEPDRLNVQCFWRSQSTFLHCAVSASQALVLSRVLALGLNSKSSAIGTALDDIFSQYGK